MTDTSSLRAFIEARLAEDERAALACQADVGTTRAGERFPDGSLAEHDAFPSYPWGQSEAEVAHITRHDPARVLREVAAKRARIELAEQIGAERGHPFWRYAGEQLLKLEAAAWSDHPDYRTEWSTA